MSLELQGQLWERIPPRVCASFQQICVLESDHHRHGQSSQPFAIQFTGKRGRANCDRLDGISQHAEILISIEECLSSNSGEVPSNHTAGNCRQISRTASAEDNFSSMVSG